MSGERKRVLGSLGLILLITGALALFSPQIQEGRVLKPGFIHGPEHREVDNVILNAIQGIPKDLEYDYYYPEENTVDAIFQKTIG